MSHSRSTSKDKAGNDDKNKSQEDKNISEISLHQKDSILESWVLTHLGTILSLMKYTCKDGLSCIVYVSNGHIVHQFMLLFFSVLTILLKISKGNRPLRCTLSF